MQEIAKRGSLHGIRGLPEHTAEVFKTSHDIGFEWHVRHQAAFQRSTDNGVSKTINLPNNATEEDVARAYRLAWELGCLGITVFRDGCKGEQVLNVGVSAKKDKSPAVAAPTGQAIIKPRPRSLKGSTYRTQTPTADTRSKQIGDLCKECGQATFVYEEGCKKCLSCGFNEC